jgi:hypothetical protein
LFWSGSSWKTIDNFEAVQPAISGINCATAQLSPGTYTAGVPYSGIMRLGYTGGNGATYTSGSTYTDNGLIAELQPGRLENGNGEFIFKVTGTPVRSSPNKTIFKIGNTEIPFYTGTAQDAEVGAFAGAEVKTAAVMKPFTFTSATESGRDGYHVVATTPNGEFSVRIFIYQGNSFQNANLQIKSNVGQVEIASNEMYAYGGGSGAYGLNQLCVMPEWCGSADNSGGNNNVSCPNTFVQGTGNFPSWGDNEVYAFSSPEQRIYSWTNKDVNDKVFYTFRFMMMTPSSGTGANTTSCPGGTCTGTKAFFLIEQITAQ